MPNFSLIFSILSPAHFEWEVNFSFKSNDEDRQMVSFIKKNTDKHLFCKSYWAHAVSSDLQEKSCKAELNNLLWNAEVRQSIWGNTPPRNEKQHNSGSLQRPNAHEGSIRCTATFKSKDYSYESAMMIGLQNYIPYSLSSARSDFSSDVVLTWRRETIIYESLNLLTSWWYNWVSSLKILAMFITSIYFEATISVKLAGQRLQY